MKTLLRPVVLILLSIISLAVVGQTAGVAIDKDAKVWVNLNVGGFWQNSDVKSAFGTGAGLTFDYYFIRNNTSIFGIGVRGQYLKGTSFGRDITPDFDIQNNTSLNGSSGNPDYASLPSGSNYVYQNYKTDVSDLSGNVIITLNRLRAVSRLNLYVFGGLGGTGYIARMDQLDLSGNLYDYDLVSSIGSKSLIKKDLKDLRDGIYETYGENGSSRTWTLNATVGAGFGVQLSDRVQIGIEHKVGFTGTDLLDANRWSSANSRNDIYQYSSLGITIGLGRISKRGPMTHTTTRNNIQATETRVNRPVIRISSPSTSTVTTENCTASISAVVDNISNKQSITITQNGAAVDFNFSGNTVTVSNINFTGTAEFIIRAANASGTVERSVSFICQPRMEMITICHQVAGGATQTINIPLTDWNRHATHGDIRGACPVIPPPDITITSPTTSPVTLENCVASVTATVQNVSAKRDITVTQNGSAVNFNFSGNTITVSNVPFTGTADFVIQATNASGTVEQSVSFICNPRVELITICHQITGGSTQTINIPLTDWNRHAAHGDTRGACPVIPPPDVTITSPASSPVTTESCVASITATVQNISAKRNITVTQNGSPVAFNFAGNTVTVPNVNFTGTADFIIRVTNASGTAEQSASFICKPRVEMITICHQVAGGASQSINIPLTDWAAHSAHGDTRGTCPVIPAPVVTITSPATSPITSEDCIASITATVQNISNKQDITVTQNGSTIPFMFDRNTVAISAVRFSGTTNFTIKAMNASGTDEQTVSFICKPKEREITICHYPPGNRNNPQAITIAESAWPAHQAHGDSQGACPVIPAPVVSITSPTVSPVASEDCIASVSARVENISNKESITVTQNGSRIPFMFDGKAVTITNIGFTGTADFIIRATNASGTAEKSVSFICKPRVEMITICHQVAGSAPQSINIPLPDWAVHAAHGDIRGACPVIPLPSVTITSPSTLPVTVENCLASITAKVDNVTAKQNIFVTQNGSAVDFNFSGNTVTLSNISFTGTANFIIKVTNASGSAEQSASFICKPKEREITICHYPPGNRNNPQAITIAESAWPAHQAHGDTQGACPVIPAPVVTITSPSSSPVTTENCIASVTATVENISEKQNIAVTQNGSPVPFNFSGNTVTISNVSFTGMADFVIKATNASGSSEQSASFICQPKEREITICHYPPGNRNNPQAITIAESAWPAHQAHGDSQGACPIIPAPVVTITSPSASPVTVENCIASVTATVENISDKQSITVTQNGSPVAFNFSGNTITISNMSFTGTADFVIKATNASGSSEQSTSFICKPKEREIAICHYPPGNRNNPQAITIAESAWPAHQAHGDTQGACPVIPAPVVTITSPSASPVTSENCIASVTATVENISDRQNITVTQNGSEVDFTFSGNTVTISNVNFTGTANFKIRATNASGTAEQSASFICQPKEITICHYPPGNRNHPQAITIAESAWPAHEAHGDTQGACPVIPAPVLTISSPANSPVTSENCVASITATVENISDRQNITVTMNGSEVDFTFSGNTVTISNVNFTGTANFKIRATNASGTAEQSASFICQPKEITICHYPPGNRNNPQAITIAESAWPAHEAHGDTQGACPVIPAPVVTITSPNSSPVTLENCIASIAATVENISDKQNISVTQNGSAVEFNFSGNTVTVSNVSFTDRANFSIKATNASGTAEQSVSFICEPKKITICHYPPGNRNNPQAITIAESAWPAHEAHGDIHGACPVIPEPVVTITSPNSSPVTLENCVASIAATVENISDKQNISVTQNGSAVDFDFSGNTVTVSNVSFTDRANFSIKATNASGTAEQSVSFICEPKKITICHYPPGNRNNPQAITIAESAWPAHEAHGDTQGACPVIPEPELIVNSPEGSSTTLEDCKASIQASVKHITGKEDISVTLNGRSVPFDYNDGTIQVSGVSFTDAVTFVIVASNRSGSVTRSVEFKCQPKEEEKKEEVKKPESDEEKITICHHPPGNTENFQTITIPISAWAAHEKHGDTTGPCKEQK